MFVLLLTIALFRSCNGSMPVISNVMATRETAQPSPSSSQSYKTRTHLDIIWSCVATLFICTWVAIHPNIPPRGEGHIRGVWRRIKLMLWTLVVPELILIWAYRQWAAAKYIAEYFKDEGWAPVHGHFMIMGGFTYIDGGVESVLDFDGFRMLLGMDFSARPQIPSEISFPMITAAEIHDKARGDFLSKAIVVLQSLWFILQCVARGKQGLALTELELVTLALASLNGVMYFFWWDKPLGVREPIKLYRKGQEPAETIIPGELSEHMRRIDRIQASSERSLLRRLVEHLRSSCSQLLEDLGSTLFSCCVHIHDQLTSISRFTFSEFIDDQREKLYFPGDTYLWPLYLPILWFCINPFMFFIRPLFGIATTRDLKSQATHVPTFYAPLTSSSIIMDMDSSRESRDLLFFVLPPIAIIFGALHCIGWNFHFPSSLEQQLWRIGSLAITFIPLILAFLAIFFTFAVPESAVLVAVLVGGFLGGAGLVAYMLARLLLLTQAVVLMRQQPESAFYAINWANFVPHL